MGKSPLDARIQYIDGIRGMAVLGVVMFHAWSILPFHNSWLTTVFRSGRHGVELFFVLSGFCLSYPTLLAVHKHGFATFNIARYGARRLVRILPPYYAAVVACGLMLWIGHASPNYHVSAPDVLRQILFLDNGTTLINPSFWTLAVEFRWYLLMPLGLLTLVNTPRVFAACVMALPVLAATKLETEDLLLLPGFLLGMVAAHVAISGHRFSRYAPLGAFALFILGTISDSGDGVGRFSLLWILTAFCLVVSIGEFRPLRALCSLRCLTMFGVASYSIYLIHQPLMLLALRISPLAVIPLPIASGFVFWWIAERPFVELPLRNRCIVAVETRLTFYLRRLAIKSPAFTLEAKEEKLELQAV